MALKPKSTELRAAAFDGGRSKTGFGVGVGGGNLFAISM